MTSHQIGFSPEKYNWTREPPDWEGQHGDPSYESEEKNDDAKIVEALVFQRAPYY